MADLTPDDVGYGGSFVINKPARLWNEKDIQDFNAKWADARKNFATYLDHDANGKRVAKDNFGGQPAFRVRLSNGQEAFMTSVPGDPFHVNVKMLNVPAGSAEAQYHPVEIRPGAGDYGNMLKEVQNATLPSGESVGSKIRPNNLGDVVSQHNNLQYAKASIENQGKARDYAASFQREQNVDKAYADAEKIVADLGPEQMKQLTNWASKEGYVAGSLQPNQKRFYDYLRDVAFISRNGNPIGSTQGVTGTQLVTSALGGLSLGFNGIGLGQPLGGVKEAAEAIKANDLDSYDVAENLHKLRLLHGQEVVNNLAVASNDPTLPLDNRTLTEGRKWGNSLDNETLQDGTKFSNTGDYTKGKTMWEIAEEQAKAAGKTPYSGAQTTDGQAVQPKKTPEQTAQESEEEYQKKPWWEQTAQDVMNLQNTPLGKGMQILHDVDIPARAGEAVGHWLFPGHVGPAPISPTPTPTPTPSATPASSPSQSPAATQTNQPSTSDHLFPKAPKAPISSTTKTPAQPSTDTGGDDTPAPRDWRDIPNLPPPKLVPIRPGKQTAQAEPVQSNVEVGAPLGANGQVPLLHHQEHVDALEPGTPFYWRDHPDAYVKI